MRPAHAREFAPFQRGLQAGGEMGTGQLPAPGETHGHEQQSAQALAGKQHESEECTQARHERSSRQLRQLQEREHPRERRGGGPHHTYVSTREKGIMGGQAGPGWYRDFIYSSLLINNSARAPKYPLMTGSSLYRQREEPWNDAP